MPDTRIPIRVSGPFGGVNELADPRFIGDTEFVQADNAVVRGGRVAPRPGYVEVAELDTNTFKRSILTGIEYLGYFGDCFIALDTVNNLLLYSTAAADNGACTEIRKCDWPTGANDQSVVAGLTAVAGLAVDPAATRVFFADGNTIKYEDYAAPAGPVTVVTAAAAVDPKGVAVDVAGNKVVWANGDDDGEIWYADATGAGLPDSNATKLCDAYFLAGRSGVDLDLVNNKCYWVDGNGPHRVDWPTGANETWIAVVPGAGSGMDVCVDTVNNRVYWSASYTPDEGIYYGATDAASYPLASSAVHRIAIQDVMGLATDGEALVFADEPGQTIGYLPFVVDSAVVVSSFWWRRSQHGVDIADEADDIVLLQVLDVGNDKTYLGVWFPRHNQVFLLACGWYAGSDTLPEMWVTNARDSDPTRGAPLSTRCGRFSFAPTGEGVNTGRGGVVIADGDDASDSPWMFNYTLPSSIQTVTDTGGAGTFTITLGDYTTASIAWNATAATVRDALIALNNVDSVYVVRAGAGPYSWAITFLGVWAGKAVEALTTTDAGGAATSVAQTQTGGGSGLGGGDRLTLCPLGLPRPVSDITNTSGPYIVLSAVAGQPTGVYNWRACWYSALFDMEGPPSDWFTHMVGVDYLDVVAAKRALYYIGDGVGQDFPATMWFNDAGDQPYPVITAIRWYRRRWGGTGGGVSPPDGSGATNVWEFTRENDVTHLLTGAGTGGLMNPGGDFSDSEIFGGAVCPVENEYPPRNANYVTVHKDQMFYANNSDGFVWNSEHTKRGPIAEGELGFGYVANNSYSVVAPREGDDTGITALYGNFGDVLVIGTRDKVLAAAVVEDGSGGEYLYVQPIRGTGGIASHWCVKETSHLPDNQGLLMWADARGWVYVFDGAGALRLNEKLRATVDGLIRRTNFDLDDFSAYRYSWYWADLLLDPRRNLILLATWTAALEGVVLCYALDRDGSGMGPAWTTWDIAGQGWIVGRSNSGTATEEVYFGTAAGKFCVLTDGAMDDGVAFTMTLRTKEITAGDLMVKKRWLKFAFVFNRRDFGGSDAQVTLTPILDGVSLTADTSTLTADAVVAVNDRDRASVSVRGTGRKLQLQLTCAQDEEDKTHPELLAYGGFGTPVAGENEG